VIGDQGPGVIVDVGIDGRTLRFTASQMGTPLEGKFTRFSSQVNVDPLQPKAGVVRARVDLASVDAGAPEANMLLRSAGFFDAAQFAETGTLDDPVLVRFHLHQDNVHCARPRRDAPACAGRGRPTTSSSQSVRPCAFPCPP
jgi:hypothetical protein